MSETTATKVLGVMSQAGPVLRAIPALVKAIEYAFSFASQAASPSRLQDARDTEKGI